MAVPAVIGVAAIAALYAGKRYFQGPKCNNKSGLQGKTVVITGGNTGIGKETAVDLARRGARVIIGCRNLQKGKEALNEIKERSGNPNVFLEEIDLSSLESVRRFADKVLNSEPRLDILINNAGVMVSRGGGVLPYMGCIGTCRGIGYGFLGSRSLNRVSFLTFLFLCPWCGP